MWVHMDLNDSPIPKITTILTQGGNLRKSRKKRFAFLTPVYVINARYKRRTPETFRAKCTSLTSETHSSCMLGARCYYPPTVAARCCVSACSGGCPSTSSSTRTSPPYSVAKVNLLVCAICALLMAVPIHSARVSASNLPAAAPLSCTSVLQ